MRLENPFQVLYRFEVTDALDLRCRFWAEDFAHALEQYNDLYPDDAPVQVTDLTRSKGVQHEFMWEFVYDHVAHFGAMPTEWENPSGIVLGFQDICDCLDNDEHRVLNAMIAVHEARGIGTDRR